jgi:hypothetical protein
MTDPFEILRGQLVAAGVEPLPRRRAPILRRPGRPLLVALAVCVVGGSAAAAAVSLSAQHSAPIAGSVPGKPSPTKVVWSEGGRKYRVAFAPVLSGGGAGWSEATLIGGGAPQGAGLGFTGGGYPTRGEPIVASNEWMGGTAPRRGDIVQWILTAGDVAAVRVGNRTIRTVASADVPAGDRVAVFFVPASYPPILTPAPGVTLPRYVSEPIAGGKAHRIKGEPQLFEVPSKLVKVKTVIPVALDASGRVIPSAPSPAQPVPPAVRSWQAHPNVAGNPSQTPTSPPAGACEIGAPRGAGITPLWGHVMDAVSPVQGALGELLLSCADTEYRYDSWPLDVALLVNAEHPGGAVGPIPATVAIPGVSGIVAGPGEAARRIGNAWLLAIGGRDQADRVALLEKLRVTGLNVVPKPPSAAARLAASTSSCLRGAGFVVAVGSAPSGPAYQLSVSSGSRFSAFVGIFASAAAAKAGNGVERFLSTPPHALQGATLERRGAATIIWMLGLTPSRRAAVDRCLPAGG